MTDGTTAIWGIHAGRTGDADALFKQGWVAVSWHQAGDLSTLPADREAFKQRYAQTYPNAKPGAIPTSGGQLYRFVHEMRPGDLVAHRSKTDRLVHLGRVTGPYVHDPTVSLDYPNLRQAKWQRSVPITQFTQGALYELGSALSLFQIKNYADEFRAALAGAALAQPVEADETVALVAEEIDETTRDFVLKTLAQELKGHPFAAFVAHLLGTMGYRSRVSPEGPDGGVDIVAHKDELGFEPPIVKVQVKSGLGNVGQPAVAALIGHLSAGEFGLVVTLGAFTAQAKSFARTKANLRLVDGIDLVELVLAHYEQFDPRYKGLLPLKRVYVPQAIGGGEG